MFMKPVAAFAILLAIAWQPALSNEVIDSTGAENFERFCSACHGISGKGDGPVAEALVNGAPDLTKIAARRDGQFSRDMIRNSIDGRFRIDAHGSASMPVWGYELYVTEGAGNFSNRNVDLILDGIVDFLESIQTDN